MRLIAQLFEYLADAYSLIYLLKLYIHFSRCEHKESTYNNRPGVI